ncbi:DNA/RNA non-specific endonuclease [Peptoniphilus sp.]|jgi:DNA-entry nuclease|uniref:DNA/RNA non-specific endonuclease n=1 Tax=Peptoniphilus sp. TaxID=1971214 RepID=UPI003D8F5165
MSKRNSNNKNNKWTAVILIALAIVGALIGDQSFLKEYEKDQGLGHGFSSFLDNFGAFDKNKYKVTEKSEYYVIDKNPPQFSEEDLKNREVYANYSPLDSLNRVGPANALLGKELMPIEKRKDISKVYPTGWHQKRFDFIEGGVLYNRCHLIGFQLAGENDNWLNLMTGTRSFNTKGMLPFENVVADYIKDTGKKVRYRVTPIFIDDELVARGVIMEAYSVEDGGKAINFRVLVKNIEKGVSIDYKTGRSKRLK